MRAMPTHVQLEYVASSPKCGRKAAKSTAPCLRKIAWVRPVFTISLLTLGIVLSLARQISAQAVEESRVKAAYLYNFAKFVEWPPGVFQHPYDPAVICVVGDERTSGILEPAVFGKRANGRPLEVRRPRSAAELKSCQVLFIGFSDKERIAPLLNGLERSSVLTVGQSDQFIRLGGMINLALKNSTIELEIDPEASSAAGLKISSRLLVIARLVKEPDQKGGAQ